MNGKRSGTKVFESQDLEDKFRFCKLYEMGKSRDSQILAREETTHAGKSLLVTIHGSRDTAREVLLGEPFSDWFGNQFLGIATTCSSSS